MFDIASLGMKIQSEDFDKASERMKRFTRDADDVESATLRLTRVAGAAAGALAAAFSVRALAGYADAWSDMQSRVGAAVKDMNAAPELMKRLVDIANASYSPLNQTVDTYARNVQVLKDLGYTAEQTADFTESLNHMLVITATKGERAASVQAALSKAMAVGKLQAEGLETVLNSGGRVAEALAEELGTTVSGLRELASQGKITGKVIAEAIGGSLEEVRRQAGEMPATIADGFTRIGTGIQAFVGQLDQALGVSAAVASGLVYIGDQLAILAQADFASWIEGVTGGLVTLAQIMLVLAATRIPALLLGLTGMLTSVASINIGTGLMVAQFTAGAAASRLMTVAMSASAVAARGLSAALAFVGGPIGLAVGIISALAVASYRYRSDALPLAESLNTVAEAQRNFNTAMKEYDNTKSTESLAAARAAADEAIAALEEAVRSAQAELATAQYNASNQNDLGLGVYNDVYQQELAAAEERLKAVMAQLDEARSKQAELTAAQAALAESMGAAVEDLTQEQVKAWEAASDMLQVSQQRIQLLKIENEYGKESAAYKVAELAQERDIYYAKVRSLNVTEDMKQALMQSWMAEQVAAGKTKEWDAAMQILRRTSTGALEVIKSIGQTEPGATWLDTAISKAQALWDKLNGAVGALGKLGASTPLGMTTGNSDWAKTALGFNLSGEELLGLPSGGSVGGGGGGGGGGEDPNAARFKQLEESFQSEMMLTMKHYAEDQAALKWALDTKKLTHEAYLDYMEQLRIETWGAEWEQTALQYQTDQEALQAALDQKIITYEDYYRKLKELQFANLLSEDNRSDMATDLDNTAKYFGQLHSLTGSGFDGLLRLQQSFQAAAAVMNAWKGYTDALAQGNLTPWMKIMWAGKILAAGLGAARAIKGGGKSGGGGGGAAGGGATTQTATKTEAPLRVTLDAIDPSAMYSGAAIQQTFDALQKEAGNRGIQWVTAGE